MADLSTLPSSELSTMFRRTLEVEYNCIRDSFLLVNNPDPSAIKSSAIRTLYSNKHYLLKKGGNGGYPIYGTPHELQQLNEKSIKLNGKKSELNSKIDSLKREKESLDSKEIG